MTFDHIIKLSSSRFVVQIEIVDMHFGTGMTHTTVDLDPYVLYDHLREIRACQRSSRSTFFIVSINDESRFLLDPFGTHAREGSGLQDHFSLIIGNCKVNFSYASLQLNVSLQLNSSPFSYFLLKAHHFLFYLKYTFIQFRFYQTVINRQQFGRVLPAHRDTGGCI